MNKIIIFNWKMNPSSLKEAKKLLTYYKQPTTNDKKVEIVVCPPFVYLSELSSVVSLRSSVNLAAQDIFWEEKGAYTGEISVKMLKNLGVEYAIIGHSERRQYLKETDEMINKKVLAGLKDNLKVVLCVGENLAIRKLGIKAVKNFVRNQLEKDLEKLSSIKHQLLKNLIITYEPIWAIGTGIPARPEDALAMIKFIKSLVVSRWSLVVSVLYGGSVNSQNIKDFIKYNEIDGALVGGTSLKTAEIKNIVKISSS